MRCIPLSFLLKSTLARDYRDLKQTLSLKKRAFARLYYIILFLLKSLRFTNRIC